jgi:adenylate kinase
MDLQSGPLSVSIASPFRIILLGPPASGKGTQGRRLAQSLGLGYLSTGAVLREHVEGETPLGKLAKPILDRGEYLPDELMCPILAEWLVAQSGGWVLDGFPRSVPQSVFLDEWLGKHGLTLDAAVSLDVPFDQLLSRIQNRVECPQCRWSGQRAELLAGDRCPVCKSVAAARPDDSEENFRSRYAEFISLTEPVIARYRQLGILRSFDATAPRDEVAARILQHFKRSA